jgi:hypothetical protein
MIKNPFLKTGLYFLVEMVFLITGLYLIHIADYVSGALFLVVSIRIFMMNQADLTQAILSNRIEKAVTEIQKEFIIDRIRELESKKAQLKERMDELMSN